jgi:hypothetical protein
MDNEGQSQTKDDQHVIEALRAEVLSLKLQLNAIQQTLSTALAAKTKPTPWYVNALAVVGALCLLVWVPVTCFGTNKSTYHSAIPPPAPAAPPSREVATRPANAQALPPTPQAVPEPPKPKPAVETQLNFSGTGTQSTAMFTLNVGLVQAAYTHNGSENFIVWLIDGQGNDVELIASEIGPIQGSKAFGVAQPGQYILSVDADGAWTVSLK